VEQMGRQLVWVRTTPFDEQVHNSRNRQIHRFAADGADYNQAADEIMAEAGVPAIDLHAFTLTLGGDLYCDHVHFREPVREKQGIFIGGWLVGWAQPNRRG